MTRIGERSDGEKLDRPPPEHISHDLVISNGYHEYDKYENGEDGMTDSGKYNMSFEDSFVSRREEEMVIDEYD